MAPDLVARARALELPSLQNYSRNPRIARYLTDPLWTYIPTTSRLPKASSEDAFFGEILNQPGTISELVTFYLRPTETGGVVWEAKSFMRLGAKLCGWPGVVHGGVQSVLMDELMGFLVGLNREMRGGDDSETAVTAELRVRFLKKVESEQVVCIKARVKREEGRKCWTEGEIEDEKGSVLASAEALFVFLREQGKL